MSIAAGRRCNWVGVGIGIGLVTPELWVGGVVSSRDAKLGSLGAAREGSLGLSRALIALLGIQRRPHTPCPALFIFLDDVYVPQAAPTKLFLTQWPGHSTCLRLGISPNGKDQPIDLAYLTLIDSYRRLGASGPMLRLYVSNSENLEAWWK